MRTQSDSRFDLRLGRVQAGSGLLFALFLAVHLANQVAAALGERIYDRTQETLRTVYQVPLLEVALVLAPLLVHAAAGLWGALRRPKPAARPPLRARLHRGSGWVLLVFFLGHVAATRGASFLFGVFPRFAGVAFTLRWVPAYFWPYYALFGAAGVFHLVSGTLLALQRFGVRGVPRVDSALRLRALAIGGAALIALGLLGFGGVLRPIDHPERSAYAHLLRRLGIARGQP